MSSLFNLIVNVFQLQLLLYFDSLNLVWADISSAHNVCVLHLWLIGAVSVWESIQGVSCSVPRVNALLIMGLLFDSHFIWPILHIWRTYNSMGGNAVASSIDPDFVLVWQGFSSCVDVGPYNVGVVDGIFGILEVLNNVAMLIPLKWVNTPFFLAMGWDALIVLCEESVGIILQFPLLLGIPRLIYGAQSLLIVSSEDVSVIFIPHFSLQTVHVLVKPLLVSLFKVRLFEVKIKIQMKFLKFLLVFYLQGIFVFPWAFLFLVGYGVVDLLILTKVKGCELSLLEWAGIQIIVRHALLHDHARFMVVVFNNWFEGPLLRFDCGQPRLLLLQVFFAELSHQIVWSCVTGFCIGCILSCSGCGFLLRVE